MDVDKPSLEDQEKQKKLEEKKQRAKKVIGQIYLQLTKGCGREFCTNKNCASNRVAFKDKKLSEKEALKIAINFAKAMNADTNDIKMCSSQICAKTIQLEEIQNLNEMSDEQLLSRYEEVFSCPFSLSFSFLKEREYYLNTEQHNIDFEAVEKYYSVLDSKFGEDKMAEVYNKVITSFYDKYEKQSNEIEEPWIFRSFLIMFQNPSLFNPLCHDVVDTITALVDKQLEKGDINLQFLPGAADSNVSYGDSYRLQRELLTSWISQFEANRILDHVQKFQSVMTINIFNRSFVFHALNNGINLLDIYNDANERKPASNKVRFQEFYNDGVNKEIELASHYEKWAKALDYCRENEIVYKKSKNFTLCNYPWLLDTASKGEIMKYEAKAQMKKFGDQDLANMFIMGLMSHNPGENMNDYMYLKFDVSRETIVEDTLNNLIQEGVNLKKQLKVNFKGEFGQDEGGVQKEFFQILVRDLFKPEYTMFNYNKESKLVWFNGQTFESNIKFELIGALMGLAIYNGVILDIHFPLVCYKKLLGLEADLSDLFELDPSSAKSLQYILDSDSPTLEQDLYLNFCIYQDVFGETRTQELVENGENIFVSQENKHEYVKLYIDYVFNKSIESPFKSFYKGFYNAVGGDSITLFRPEELQLLICGCKKLDFAAMKRETRYDGFEGDEEVLDWFWEILLDELNEEQQKRFLFFCTGCDKAPVLGLESINFIIVKHGEDDEKLPCAQTCFNVLLLPEYSNRDRLKEALLLAIENAEGFGLL